MKEKSGISNKSLFDGLACRSLDVSRPTYAAAPAGKLSVTGIVIQSFGQALLAVITEKSIIV
jgi:hypothetical protein